MKILVVEDDPLAAEAIVTVLTHQNYAVEVVADGEAGWSMVDGAAFDLVLLDIMVPRLSGLDLCRRIRSHGYQMPILLLTGRDSGHDKAIGLDAGADDYVVKPFDAEELIARIRALLRRGTIAAQPILEWNGLRLDPSICGVTYNGTLVPVTPKEYGLLELFLRNNQRVFSCNAILEHLWTFDDAPGEEAVRTHMKGLRQKLKAAGAPTDLIETVYGIGYRLKPREEVEQKQNVGKSAVNSSNSAVDRTSSSQQTLAAIGAVWNRFKPRVIEQIDVLRRAADALAAKTLNPDLQMQAKAEAHTLAGSLGTFGFHKGSQIARSIEQLLQASKLQKSEVKQLQELVMTLSQELELLPADTATSNVESGSESRSQSGDGAAQSPTTQAPTPTATVSASILAVDDDAKILAVLQTLLEPWGLNITTLDDPTQLWQVLTNTAPDLLILDLHMPHSNGIEICHAIREDDRWSSLPIMVLTADTEAATVNQVFAAGADDFVTKPIVGPELVTRIVNRLERAKLLRRLDNRTNKTIPSLPTPSSPTPFLTLPLDLLCTIGTDGYLKQVNPAFTTVLGYSQDQLLAQPLLDFIHPDDRDATAANLASLFASSSLIEFENHVCCKDGSYRWLIWKAASVTEVGLVYAIAHDVTQHEKQEQSWRKTRDEIELRVAERTVELVSLTQRLQQELDAAKRLEVDRDRVEAALRVSQSRFAGILEIADDAIISIDTGQKITLFNQGAEKTFGYSAQEILGKPLDVLLPLSSIAMHRRHIETFGNSYSHARRMGERSPIFGRRKNGSEFPAEASISYLEFKGEKVFTVILRDVTERSKIDRMKDEFISVVSHELRTPLTSIHGSLGMLASGLLSADSERGKRLLQIAVDSTDRLVRLINDVLDIERIESGKVTMVKQSCNVTDLIDRAVDGVQAIADRYEVSLAISTVEAEVWADGDRVIQTVTNLLSNAIKFSNPDSTVWLSVELQEGEMPTSTSVPVSLVPTPVLLFTVNDQGRGIPSDKLEAIFERFQQVDASDSRNHEGTGLGLAICRSIVQQHGGRIWVESVLGEGSTFYFTLPLSSYDLG